MEMKENRGIKPHWCGCCAVISAQCGGGAHGTVGYPLRIRWGVSLHAVRRAASYSPDHAFARFLYPGRIYVSCSCRPRVADPYCSLCRRTPFWGRGEEFRTRREPRHRCLAYVAGPAAGGAGWRRMLRRCSVTVPCWLFRGCAVATAGCRGRVDGDALAARFAGDGSVLVRKAAEALAEAGKESAPEL